MILIRSHISFQSYLFMIFLNILVKILSSSKDNIDPSIILLTIHLVRSFILKIKDISDYLFKIASTLIEIKSINSS